MKLADGISKDEKIGSEDVLALDDYVCFGESGDDGRRWFRLFYDALH